MTCKQVLIVGCGPMAVEYAKVLKALGKSCVVVGRGSSSAEAFTSATGLPAVTGGLEKWLMDCSGQFPDHAIVAVGEKWLGQATQQLLDHGFSKILLEKPGGLDAADIRAVQQKSQQKGASVFLGYNRRFFASVQAAKKIIADDGGVVSFNFEFTEWGHVISGLEKEEGVKEQWFLANSTHVIDLAFHLGGWPREMTSYAAGFLDWHRSACVFAGAGRSDNGALFSYQANWAAPGRWGVEVLTNSYRLIFRPMESLQIMQKGAVRIDTVEIDDSLDKEFKPGLYEQVARFLDGRTQDFCSIAEQVEHLNFYSKMAGTI